MPNVQICSFPLDAVISLVVLGIAILICLLNSINCLHFGIAAAVSVV
jgi:hypothetical protein